MAFLGAFQPGTSTVGSLAAGEGGAAAAVTAARAAPSARIMVLRMWRLPHAASLARQAAPEGR
jgi:hypothetical protein